jgi:S-DNA-T family DNA segregation ATPase FtsK/SpoIIIE
MALSLSGIRALWPSSWGLREQLDRPSAHPEPPPDEFTVDPADEELRGENNSGGAPDDEPPRRGRSARSYAREAAALLLIAVALYAALALASYEGDPLRPEVAGENWVGPVGAVFAASSVRLVGAIAWLVPLEMVLLARPLLRDRPIKLSLIRISGDIVIVAILAALTHISMTQVTTFGAMPVGGNLGVLFGEVLRGLFSTVGSFLIGLTVVALILVERATFSFIEMVQRVQAWVSSLRLRGDQAASKVASAWSQAREADKQRREDEREAEEPLIASPEQADAIIAAFADDGEGYAMPLPVPPVEPANGVALDDAADAAPGRVSITRAPAPVTSKQPAERDAAERDAALPSPSDEAVTPDASAVDRQAVTPTPELAESVAELADADDAVDTPSPIAPVVAKKTRGATKRRRKKAAPPPVEEEPASEGQDAAPDEPKIVDTSGVQRTKKARRRAKANNDFQLPGPELLDPVIGGAPQVDSDKLKETARLLEKTLADYGVEGRVQEIHPGPTVTLFEVSPKAGTKVSKVAGLADDLALGLSRKVRIIAPIPGKNRIGFEVPNAKRMPVNLRELLESRDFMDMKAPLPCVLGRDIIGRPFFADLAGMPHVIVAGATGAGKSVGLNVMLLSLLYRRTPEEMRLLMIDPKVVELAPFDRIPHLLFPVVTDMKQASNALRWAVDEMERRYQLFADAGTRNIVTYNRWVGRVEKGEVPMPKGPAKVDAVGPAGEQLEIPAAKDGSDAELPKRLPYIVVVVEEFADLMMQQGKEVEASVARLAQKARAAGLHVILATQRPSVDVITGMIKANFPTRIAYRVAQKVDSRTILDQQGAEHLLGRGDMLVKLNGTNDVRRVQCPFAQEDEVQAVTDFLRAQGEPDYDESIVKGPEEDDNEGRDPSDAENDPLYDQAVRVVADTAKCSTSWLQRKLGVGYNRAAKIVETMERNGIVGPQVGSKPREIFISPQ